MQSWRDPPLGLEGRGFSQQRGVGGRGGAGREAGMGEGKGHAAVGGAVVRAGGRCQQCLLQPQLGMLGWGVGLL